MDPAARDALEIVWLWLTIAVSVGFIVGFVTGRIERRRTRAEVDSQVMLPAGAERLAPAYSRPTDTLST